MKGTIEAALSQW